MQFQKRRTANFRSKKRIVSRTFAAGFRAKKSLTIPIAGRILVCKLAKRSQIEFKWRPESAAEDNQPVLAQYLVFGGVFTYQMRETIRAIRNKTE
jgi:hypothetical protein